MKRAFTLIEQLAALALLALFAAAMLAVLRGMAKLQPPRPSGSQRAFDRAIEQISCDLAQSQRVTFGENRLVLGGFGSLDSATLAPTHRPVHVEYWLEQPVGGRSRLWRSQRNLDVLSNRNAWTTCLCDGVTGFEVAPLGVAPPATRPVSDAFAGVAAQPVPAGAQVTLRAVPEFGFSPVRRTVWMQGGR